MLIVKERGLTCALPVEYWRRVIQPLIVSWNMLPSVKYLRRLQELWIEVRWVSGQSSIRVQLEKIEDVVTKNMERRTSKQTVQIGKLDIDRLWVVGKWKEKKNWEEFQSRYDHIIMQLVCIWELVPHNLDSLEWEEMINLLNNHIHPTASMTYTTKIIP